MRRLNVLPPELSGIRLPWWHGDPLLLWGRRSCMALALGFVMVVVTQQARLFAYERSYAHVKELEQKVNLQLLEQRERAALIQSSLENLEGERTLLEQKLRFILKQQHKGPFWSIILTDIAELLGPSMRLGEFEGTPDQITLEGHAPSPQEINTLIGELNRLERFNSIRLNFTEAEQKEKMHEYRFEISAGLR
ncbi:MAG: PilN domain-containing protein [Candidatus Omnitrophica bacterium]|nr:PilN domain-containing protein [Candidatus Omnitrophota bacterium]